FSDQATLVEIDGATARFDERGIADPLIGSVHDPIYQGAGALGLAGVPQPKAGAVTKAHGGLLFIDEIGELHPIQINKLLKVLEDRKVILESAYYSQEDLNIPKHIHEIFQNGLPADFRLVGATTRLPQEIPAAVRSRCLEICFRPLTKGEIGDISRRAADKLQMTVPEAAVAVIQRYANNGRDAVNIVQIAAGLALTREETSLRVEDLEWVVHSGQYNPRPDKKIPTEPQIGAVNGLAVSGPLIGTVMEIETAVTPALPGRGKVTVTGIIDQEEMDSPGGRKVRRRSLVNGSIENVLTVLKHFAGINPRDWDIHINFPGGTAVDGPSAGIAIATAINSAIKGFPVDNKLALTGELSVRGYVQPVGGVVAKVEAARLAGITRVIIPVDNWLESFRSLEQIRVIPVERVEQVFAEALRGGDNGAQESVARGAELVAASAFGLGVSS
ncbi:MAG: magnesium chelatase domain-containing protein, partial [Heliobacteriaceae bacterium]|nr:magnesium chelatase domain-containing protein [Heliobacteriaceae bacterium]